MQYFDIGTRRYDSTLKSIQDACYDNAKELGWTEQEVPIPEMIALCHSELSEALEEYRNNTPITYASAVGKPEGIASEFADVIIRLGHYAQLLGIDLEHEVIRKLRYNITRPHRHGGKKA